MDKVMLITGANSGIGKAASVELAKSGAHVVMVCRDIQKGEIARREVIAASGNSLVDLMTCDLGSLASVREFVQAFKSRYSRLDVLINNAGIYVENRMETVDGFEYQIGVNHLGPFLLTNLLVDLLKQSAPSRIINVSSGAHIGGTIRFEDIHSRKKYSPWIAYAQSKLANVLFTYELSHRLAGTGVTANCLHPGFVRTQFAVDRKTNRPNPMMTAMKWLSIPPEKGAETTVFLASSPDVQGTTGKYFVRKKAKASSRASYDLNAAQRLWELSEELVKE